MYMILIMMHGAHPTPHRYPTTWEGTQAHIFESTNNKRTHENMFTISDHPKTRTHNPSNTTVAPKDDSNKQSKTGVCTASRVWCFLKKWFNVGGFVFLGELVFSCV
jgi:hypothetical protein